MEDIFINERLRKDYICKSDITRYSLDKMGMSSIAVDYAKQVFDELPFDNKFVTTFLTGNPKDVKRQRHTKFIHKKYFYKAVIKGF